MTASLLAAGAVVTPVVRGRRTAAVSRAVPASDAGSRTTRGAMAGEIAPDVFCLGPWGRTQTNVYLVRAGSSWALVDAGWEGDGPRIEAAARTLLGPDSRPAAILLTHAHPDHAGSARALAEAWGCPIFVHPTELPLASGDLAAMQRYAGPLDRWLILPLVRALGRRQREAMLSGSSLADIVHPLGSGGEVPGLPGWAWIHTPGHTPGHVAYFRADDRVLLTGDSIVTLAVNTWSGLLLGRQGLSSPPWYTTWDRRAAAASIARIAALEPLVLAGGHGWPLARPGSADALRAFAARQMNAEIPPAPALPHRWLHRLAMRFINPLVKRLGFAGAPGSPIGLVLNVGRRTGRRYATPLAVHRRGDRLYIPLTYGPDARWCGNVLASGACRVRLGGRELRTTAPRVVGRAMLPASLRRRYRPVPIREFLELTVADEGLGDRR